MSFTLGGTAIAIPSKFDFEWYTLTKAGRVTSGKMTMEKVADKRKFNLHYNAISGTDLDTILDILYGSSNLFFAFVYIEPDGSAGSKTVYAGAVKGEFLRNAGTRLFTDIEFSLIEQ